MICSSRVRHGHAQRRSLRTIKEADEVDVVTTDVKPKSFCGDDDRAVGIDERRPDVVHKKHVLAHEMAHNIQVLADALVKEDRARDNLPYSAQCGCREARVLIVNYEYLIDDK